MTSHINHVILAFGHPRRHIMHKYWARKPYNVVAEYIKHYSESGEIVLDPFSGSGVTAIEAVRLKRKAIAIDIDPVASFITQVIAEPIGLTRLEETYEEIRKNVKKRINDLYVSTCHDAKPNRLGQSRYVKDRITNQFRYVSAIVQLAVNTLKKNLRKKTFRE